MEKALVVSILEKTYLNLHDNSYEDKKNLLPENWSEMSLDDKIIILDRAISSGDIIRIETEEIEEEKKL